MPQSQGADSRNASGEAAGSSYTFERNNPTTDAYVEIDTSNANSNSAHQYNAERTSGTSQVYGDQVIAPSQQDQRLKEQTDQIKSKLIADLNKMSIKNVDLDEGIVEIEDPRSRNFLVLNPIKLGGHIKYTVKGIDSEGEFEE